MGLPQREGRPALSIAPEDWPADSHKGCQEDYDDLGMNPLNNPVDERKGAAPVNGWMTVASDTVSEGEDFGPGKGGEKR